MARHPEDPQDPRPAFLSPNWDCEGCGAPYVWGTVDHEEGCRYASLLSDPAPRERFANALRRLIGE